MPEPETTASPDTVVPRWLMVVALVVLAANLRAAVNVVGPLLPDIRAQLGLSDVMSGVFTALPPFAFAVFGAIGPVVARRLGTAKTVIAGLVALTAGQVLRAVWPSVPALIVGSLLALMSIAIANVLIPAVIARYFARQAAVMTALYTVSLAALAAAASAVTLPVQHALGGTWQLGLGMWAILSAIGLVPWLVVAGRERGGPPPARTAALSMATVARSGKAWALMVLFGIQGLHAYIMLSWYPTMLRDAGLELAVASAYTGVIAFASAFGSLAIPFALNRLQDYRGLILVLSSLYLLGYVGTAFAPVAAPGVWAAAIGLGSSFFPMTLYMMSQRGRTPSGVLALSGFAQSLGYVITAVGLVAFGAIFGHTTQWRVPIFVLMGLVVVMTAAAFVGAGRWYIEDEVGPSEPVPAGSVPPGSLPPEPATRS